MCSSDLAAVPRVNIGGCSSNNSKSKFQPFHKPKVKIKKEVVPMNLTIKSRERNLNTHLNPKEWNDLIKKKDTHVIDTRKS